MNRKTRVRDSNPTPAGNQSLLPPPFGPGSIACKTEIAKGGAKLIQFTELAGAGEIMLETEQLLPQPRARLFEFFTDVFQLQTITPTWLNFSILTPGPVHVAVGTIIDYRLRLHRVPIHWQSRISAWQPPVRFVDEQVHGPYRLWRHEHILDETGNGVICRDLVTYKVPGGRLIDRIFVRRELRKIFQLRQRKLAELFAGAD